MQPQKQKLPKIVKQKVPKEAKVKAPKPVKQKAPKAEKQKIPTSLPAGAWKTAVIIVLAAALVAESVFLVVGKLKTPDDTAKTADGVTQFVLNVDMSGITNSALDGVSKAAVSAIDDIKDGIMPELDIMGTVKGLIYSDSIVNTVMSMSFPLLKRVLEDLDMMDFAENVALYPTPVRLAPLFADKGYSCMNAEGVRKPLFEVLQTGGDDWTYFDTKVPVTDKNGAAKQETLWNTIVWGVNGKDTFYKAMNDMSEGIRGVLEICMQGKQRVVNINLADFLLNFDKVNVPLDAATIYNSSEKSGYELCLVPLFNMLGLRDGEYLAPDAFTALTATGDMWSGILEPVLKAVEKAMNDPMQSLPDMLVNFADAVDGGTLAEGMKSLRMDADFHKLAQSFMGYENGLLFNLGEALIEIVGSLGIDLSGSFNGILDSLLRMILKNPSADMPDMDVASLKACSVQTTLPNGNKVWSANSEQIINYLVNYVVQGKTIELILSQTPLAGTPEAAEITAAIDKSRDGLTDLVDVILGMVLDKIQ